MTDEREHDADLALISRHFQRVSDAHKQLVELGVLRPGCTHQRHFGSLVRRIVGWLRFVR